MISVKGILRLVIPLLAFGFLGSELYKLAQDVDTSNLSFRGELLACSFALLALVFIADAAGWNLILHSLNQRLPWQKAIYIWFYSSLSRYIPGIIWPYLSRIQMCSKQGISKTVTTASMILENALLASSSILLSSPLLLLYFELNLFKFFGVILSATALLVIIFCLIRNSNQIASINRYLLPVRSFDLKKLFPLALFYIIFWLVFGYCFLLMCESILTIDPDKRLLVAMVFPVSFAIGFIVSISPGGLGIREGVMYTLLLPLLGSPNAALIAVFSRIWLVTMEAFIAIVICAAIVIKRGLRIKRQS